MDGRFGPAEEGLIGLLRAEVAQLERAHEIARAERAALLERLAAAQATQHETVMLLGRFLAAREREKAEWEAALARERKRAAHDAPKGDAPEGAAAPRRKEAPPRAPVLKALPKPPERAACADDDFSSYPILTFDHVERPVAGSRSLAPIPSAAVTGAPAMPIASGSGDGRVVQLARIGPLVRLERAARQRLARLRVGTPR